MCWQCAYLTDVFSSSDRADSLQFDHHVNTLHSVPGVLRWFAVPGRSADSGHIDAAFVEPPTAAVVCRTVECTCYVVVHVQRRKFQPVVRHLEIRSNAVEEVIITTDSTAHNIAADVLVNNRTQTKTMKVLLIHIIITFYSTSLFHYIITSQYSTLERTLW